MLFVEQDDRYTYRTADPGEGAHTHCDEIHTSPKGDVAQRRSEVRRLKVREENQRWSEAERCLTR